MEWSFTQVLTVAYGCMGVVALCGYIPQLIAFFRNPRLCLETPLTSWALWGCQTVVFHAYAVLVNGDIMFMATTGAFMVMTLACLSLQLYGRRHARRHGLTGRRGAEIVPFPTLPQPQRPLEPRDAA